MDNSATKVTTGLIDQVGSPDRIVGLDLELGDKFLCHEDCCVIPLEEV